MMNKSKRIGGGCVGGGGGGVGDRYWLILRHKQNGRGQNWATLRRASNKHDLELGNAVCGFIQLGAWEFLFR